MAMTFNGGVKMPTRKIIQKTDIQKIAPVKYYYFELNQHKGAPLKPTVGIGEHVKIGQKIADNEEYTAVPVHSSVSGIVADLLPQPGNAQLIVIENDFKDEVMESLHPIEDIDSLSKREMLWVVRDAGIIGMGKGGFPTHIKLAPSRALTSVIANCAESNPFSSADAARAEESTQEIIDGLEIVMKILDVKKAYIGVGADKKEALMRFRQLLRYRNDIEVMPLKNKYPQGGEKLMIRALTGKEVPDGALPEEVQTVVFNVQTLYAVNNIFKNGMPLVDKVITVTGDMVSSPANFLVKIGTPISKLLEEAGCNQNACILLGSGMNGTILEDTNLPVTKTTPSVAALSYDVSDEPESACLNCGRCQNACPIHLMPNRLERAVTVQNAKKAEKLGISSCINCGVCSYVCPSKRDIANRIKQFTVKEEQTHDN